MRRHNLTNAQNLLFLQIEWLARQQRWRDIWNDDNYPELVHMRAPRPVRIALLTAFHSTQLAQYEVQQAWQNALERFRNNRDRLGRLLTTRMESTRGPVLRLFAYQAAAADDWALMHELLLVPTDDEETKSVLTGLNDLVQPTQSAIQESAQAALHRRDYDRAIELSGQMADATERAMLLLQIAYETEAVAHARSAQASVDALATDQRARLQTASRKIQSYQQFVEQLLNPAPDGPEPIYTWVQWFQQLIDGVERDDYEDRIIWLTDNVTERDWSSTALAQLEDQLTELYAADRLSEPTLEVGLHELINYFLADREFPQIASQYAAIYEVLFNAAALRSPNETHADILLRLAEAVLLNDAGRASSVANVCVDWFAKPQPNLESQAIACLELLADYGLDGTNMRDFHRHWVERMILQPEQRPLAHLQAWYALGERWTLADQDVIYQLQNALAEQAQTDDEAIDPIAALPGGYRIGIYTLREKSAVNARERLLERNNSLDIRIYSNYVMSDRARQIADHSDTVVIVTACIKHALTYGLTAIVSDPLYVNTSGATGIIRAIEAA